MADNERDSKYGDIIRARFKKLGGFIPISDLVRDLIAHPEGLPEEALNDWAYAGCSNDCRLALKSKDPSTGLPWAKPTTGGKNPDWKQLKLFSYEEAEDLIMREQQALIVDYEHLELLHGWCLEKFGKAPKIVKIVGKIVA